MASRDLTVNILGNNAGAKKALTETDQLTSKFGVSTSAASSLVAGGWMAAATAVVGFGAKSIATFQSVGVEVLKIQRYTGDTAEKASDLRFAAQQSGIGVDQLAKGLGFLSKNLENAPQKFRDYGIATTDATGKTLSLHAQLLTVADRFKDMPNGAEKTAMALSLFGKAGADLLPMLNKGSAGLLALEKQTKSYGLELTGANLNAVKASREASRDLSAAWQGLQVQLGQQLIPKVTEMTGQFASLVQGMSQVPGVIDNVNKKSDNMLSSFAHIVTLNLPAIWNDVGNQWDKAFNNKDPVITVEDFATKAGIATDKAQAFLDTQKAAGTTYTNTGDALKDFNQQEKDSADAAQEAADAVKAQDDALKALNDSLHAAIDPVFAVTDALKKQRDARGESTKADWEAGAAQKAYTEAVKLHGPKSAEARDAALALFDAQQHQRDSQEALIRSNIDFDTSMNTLNDKLARNPELLKQATGQLAAMAQEGNITAAQAIWWGDQFRRTAQDAQIHGSIGIDDRQALGAIWQVRVAMSGLMQQLNDAGNYAIMGGASGGMHAHASGGMLNEGWNLVGEKGPELINKSGSSAMVHTAGQSAAMMSGPTININVTGGLVMQQDLLKAVTQAVNDGTRPSRVS